MADFVERSSKNSKKKMELKKELYELEEKVTKKREETHTLGNEKGLVFEKYTNAAQDALEVCA